MKLTIWKWTHCFVEWEQKDGTVGLSVIPWRILLMGIFSDTSNFKWKWIPPWKVCVDEG